MAPCCNRQIGSLVKCIGCNVVVDEDVITAACPTYTGVHAWY